MRAVVVDGQRGEMGHQLDQVEPAVLEAPMTMFGAMSWPPVHLMANSNADCRAMSPLHRKS